MISLKEASAYLETALFGVFYYQLITIFRIFGFLQHQMVSHLSQKDQLQDLGYNISIVDFKLSVIRSNCSTFNPVKIDPIITTTLTGAV
ncbi:MAG: hypothetical protein SD837_13425 [Candidatus Electrothrix scaldis]|nr:MAG: hypothetical protein SD837_13425 [Candidatus Electrothrix sp. GW3-3]